MTRKRRYSYVRECIANYVTKADRADRELVGDYEPEKGRKPITIDDWVTLVLDRRAARRALKTRRRVKRDAMPPRRDRPLCGAKTRAGGTCQMPAEWNPETNKPRNGRCRLHGGLSTGPRTKEGKARTTQNLPNNRKKQ